MNEIVVISGSVISAVIVLMSVLDVYYRRTREWGENIK